MEGERSSAYLGTQGGEWAAQKEALVGFYQPFYCNTGDPGVLEAKWPPKELTRSE
jgi:hypothetical protein